mmetsp:Transcript_28175/g.70367  ORF Transcript_28175/g.70367 Transcript_28175/m.70367 type:complete len:98 (-) Transcript_28175:210-503(-)
MHLNDRQRHLSAEEIPALQDLATQALSRIRRESREAGKQEGRAEATDCQICQAVQKNTLLIPCNHVCVCSSCAQTLMRNRHPLCPICRQEVRRYTPV